MDDDLPKRAHLVDKAPGVRFSISDESDRSRIAWFSIEPSPYGVAVNVHRADPGDAFADGQVVAQIHVDFFLDRVSVQIWDEAEGLAGDMHWLAPDGHEYDDHQPPGASIVIVRRLLGVGETIHQERS